MANQYKLIRIRHNEHKAKTPVNKRKRSDSSIAYINQKRSGIMCTAFIQISLILLIDGVLIIIF